MLPDEVHDHDGHQQRACLWIGPGGEAIQQAEHGTGDHTDSCSLHIDAPRVLFNTADGILYRTGFSRDRDEGSNQEKTQLRPSV